MILNRLSLDCDLSEMSFEKALKEVFSEQESVVLVVSPALIDIAIKLWPKVKVETILPQEAWYIVGKWDGIYSPGV